VRPILLRHWDRTARDLPTFPLVVAGVNKVARVL
jgi:hypothetical protein